MKKQTMTLVEIGIVYLAVSIVLDYFLGNYEILLLLALSFEFILFGIIIFSSLWEHLPQKVGREESIARTENDLTRLEHSCEAAFSQGDHTAENQISERVRSLAFAAAANRLNIPEATLRSIAREEPKLLQSKIKDPQLLQALISKDSMIQKGNTQVLEDVLDKIEEWTA